MIGALLTAGLILAAIQKQKRRKRMFTEENAKEAINALKQVKGIDRAKLVEQMLRIETDNFKSKQYKLTGSAGMEDGKWRLKHLLPYFPGGKYKTITIQDNHRKGRYVKFIVWNSVKDFVFFLSDYIDRNGAQRWNPVNPDYLAEVQKIKTLFV